MNGNIVFQIPTLGQSRVIQLAIQSKYSHYGIIYKPMKIILFLRPL